MMESSCKVWIATSPPEEADLARRHSGAANCGDRGFDGYIARLFRKDAKALGRILMAIIDLENKEENRELRREAARARARQRRGLRR
jgi:hypothetical protein